MPHEILALIAQQPTQPPASNPQSIPVQWFISLGLLIGVFYFVLIRGNRKQQKERQGLIDNLSKNDRVMTIGGIIGTVVSVRDDEVVVKVDESNNTKLTFIKKSIQQVLKDRELPTPG